jgi:hypothetical protein
VWRNGTIKEKPITWEGQSPTEHRSGETGEGEKCGEMRPESRSLSLGRDSHLQGIEVGGQERVRGVEKWDHKGKAYHLGGTVTYRHRSGGIGEGERCGEMGPERRSLSLGRDSHLQGIEVGG